MTDYCGRFAPTPSGPLHFGSLFAAVISYLDAKAHQGRWQIRVEDIDPPREQPGAADHILSTLEGFGLYWDGPITYQSQQSARYETALFDLQRQGRLFWCNCSRKQLKGFAIYPGTCRAIVKPRTNSAIRFLTQLENDQFDDAFQGLQRGNIRGDYGDVILKRRDQLYAYQLAVVCDDIAEKVTHVIRGIDLMTSTFWQRELYRALGHEPPSYGHFAVVHEHGSTQKLSKQNLAKPIDAAKAPDQLHSVFKLIGLTIEQDVPSAMLTEAGRLYKRALLEQKQILHRPENRLD